MNRLKELRIKKGIKQSDLAKLFNLTQGTLSNWEVGRHDPDNLSLLRLSEYFNVTIDYLLGNADNPAPPSLTVPYILEEKNAAFDRSEFKDLTQDEIDSLAVIAIQLKKMNRL